MKLTVKETVTFALLGVVMFVSKIAMEALPNIHLLAVLTVTYTIVFRKKALYPIYVYVLLNGLVSGFNLWWIPYLYIWTILWAVAMLLPKNMNKKIAIPVYMLVCGLHGLLFGVMYAPAQAFMYGLSFKGTIAWIVAGFPFDAIQGAGNFVLGLLILPLTKVIKIAMKE